MEELPTTSSPPTTVLVGRWGQQRGAAPALPLDTATAVSDTLIVARHGRFQCAKGGVLFVPKVAPSKHWVAKILVEVLVAHDLADIGKKNELELARLHWHAKKMATIQTKTNLWVMTKILVRCTLATIQTHPNTRLVEDARGAATRPRSGVARPTASSGPETMPGRLAFPMTCGDHM